ncbi:hypothetical protein R1sor_007590 [Riccia sorocarpa]|uniref:AtTam37 zinc finger domain-containing protein n=1 Tax=Riccia sorocarpa TaxID=122646 RepID=A0ABD3HTF5_9MARC
MDKWLREASRRGAIIGEALKDAAFEISWGMQDAAKTGFGLPRFMSRTASLGVATVAAAGAASVAFDMTGKFFGKRECNTCNGWEGLRCTLCRGSGRVRYSVNDSSLPEAERENPKNVAAAALEDRAEIQYVSGSLAWDLPLPFGPCPACDATGVVICSTCEGDSWKPKLNFDNLMNAPWQSWDVQRKVKPEPIPGTTETVADPALAAFNMYAREEVEEGFSYDEDVKDKMMYKYHAAREYDEIRDKIVRREPGWENLQEILAIKDPERALSDPVIIIDTPLYYAKAQIKAEVNELPVPPRPEKWMSKIEYPLKESDWSKEDLKDPKVKAEMEALLRGQEQFYNSLRDRSWEMMWRKKKVAEVTRSKINAYESGVEAESETYQPAQPEAFINDVDVLSTPVTTSAAPTKPAVQKKPESRKRPEDERKKRERQERAERMARQAAEREAALARAKAAKEKRSGF